MHNYKFRISGSDTTVDIVKDRIRRLIGDSIVGLFDNYTGPDDELGQKVVYGNLSQTNSTIDKVRRNFVNAFSPEYIASVDEDN